MPTTHNDKTSSEDAAREATEWFVRLSNPLATDRDRAVFQDWLKADPARAQAMQETEDLWRLLDEPAARLGRGGWYKIPQRPGRRQRGWLARLAIPGLVMGLVAAALVWRDPGMIDRLRADHATSPGERREVRLADGSRILLDGDTAISERMTTATREITMMRGRAWFDVAGDPARPFSVIAGPMRTEVIGTTFSVDRGTARVVVGHGIVAVSSKAEADRSVRLTDNERVGLVGGRLGATEDVAPGAGLAWTRGLIVLDAAPLEDVVNELARMAPGRVMIDPRLSEVTLSGVFHADDPDAVIEAVRTGLGLRAISVPGFATLIYR